MVPLIPCIAKMKFLIAFSLLVAAVSSVPLPMYPYMWYGAHPNWVPSTQYRAQDVMGNYNYGFASADGIIKSEMRAMDGSVMGGYSYTSPEGKMIDIKYTAGKDGFKAMGDALPKAPEMTMENKKAMEEHMMAKDEAEKKAAEPAKMEEPMMMMPMKMDMKDAKPMMMPMMMPMKMEMKEMKDMGMVYTFDHEGNPMGPSPIPMAKWMSPMSYYYNWPNMMMKKD